MNICIHCGKELVQKRFSSVVLESPSMLARRTRAKKRPAEAGWIYQEVVGYLPLLIQEAKRSASPE